MMINWWSSDNHLLIICWSSEYHMMITWWSSDDHLLIICWSSEYHIMINWWSSDYDLIIIWWSTDDNLKNIREGSDYHKKIMCHWLSYDHGMMYHVIILRWSSYVHVMIIWISYDYQAVTCLNCSSLQINICTVINGWSSDHYLIIILWTSEEHFRREWL